MGQNFLKHIIYFGGFLMSGGLWAQTPEAKILEGKVYSQDGDVAATHVLNTTSQKAAITDVAGLFSIGAHLHDTLVFSAVQYQKKMLVVTPEILESKFISVALEEANIALDEVVVTPYNLTGELGRDLNRLTAPETFTAAGLGLPNAHVKPLTQSERLLREAAMDPLTFNSIPLNPIINAINGRSKMLKKRVARDKRYARFQGLRLQFEDSIFVQQLRIPIERIEDFLYFCEVDTDFNNIVDAADELKIWDFLNKKSILYRENNALK